MRRAGSHYVYLVEAMNGLVKIGSGHNPSSRAAVVAQYSPVPSRLIAMWPGTESDEHALHREFDAYRSHREWFRIQGALTAFVSDARGCGVSSIPEWGSLTYRPRGAVTDQTRALKSAVMKAYWADPKWRERQLRSRNARSA